jgi:hypothetical protein
MSNILHVLNGDSTMHSFNQTGLDGDVMVWREVLSEGPLEENISAANFWNARSKWIGETFNEATAGYQHKVIDELGKLNGQYDEINLWFEFDLHCQVNLLGVMQMLNQQTNMSAPAVFLICPDDFPGIDDFRGMGQLNGDQLEDLYDSRVQLSDWEFELAAQAWPLYVKGDTAELEQWINDTTFWGSLHLLNPALLAHLKRLSINAAGLNHIEQKLLDIYNSGITSKPEIYHAFWATEQIYGMGDSEIDIYLNRLKQKQPVNF